MHLSSLRCEKPPLLNLLFRHLHLTGVAADRAKQSCAASAVSLLHASLTGRDAHPGRHGPPGSAPGMWSRSPCRSPAPPAAHGWGAAARCAPATHAQAPDSAPADAPPLLAATPGALPSAGALLARPDCAVLSLHAVCQKPAHTAVLAGWWLPACPPGCTSASACTCAARLHGQLQPCGCGASGV